MKESALRFLVLVGLFNTLSGHLIVYVAMRMTWPEARNFCREEYTDLLSINNEKENKIVSSFLTRPAWIGLYKIANDTWKWSGGQNASFFRWSLQRNNSDDEYGRCVVKGRNGWRRMNCETKKFPFMCYESTLVLVKENKTWEDAMEHCRHLGKELISLPSESALASSLQTSRKAQTDHVWTGLRYLASRWLWVDASSEYHDRNQEEMPKCPVRSHRCGALSLEGGYWTSWDCTDTLNFVCY